MKKYNEYKNISKAQIEVWEMKESIYKEVEHLPINEALLMIMENSQKITENYLKEKLTVVN